MTTTAAQIDLWRQAPSEYQDLEFKEAKNNFDREKLSAYCVAIANEGGGHLVLGVADSPPRPVVGSAAFANLVDTAASKGRLIIELTAGKYYTTLAAITRMRELCRLNPKGRNAGCTTPLTTDADRRVTHRRQRSREQGLHGLRRRHRRLLPGRPLSSSNSPGGALRSTTIPLAILSDYLM